MPFKGKGKGLPQMKGKGKGRGHMAPVDEEALPTAALHEQEHALLDLCSKHRIKHCIRHRGLHPGQLDKKQMVCGTLAGRDHCLGMTRPGNQVTITLQITGAITLGSMLTGHR